MVKANTTIKRYNDITMKKGQGGHDKQAKNGGNHARSLLEADPVFFLSTIISFPSLYRYIVFLVPSSKVFVVKANTTI